jgi:hypothetical protein
MGKIQLDGSGRCETETARLSSVEKENGSCTESKVGERQAREEGSLERNNALSPWVGLTTSSLSSRATLPA